MKKKNLITLVRPERSTFTPYYLTLFYLGSSRSSKNLKQFLCDDSIQQHTAYLSHWQDLFFIFLKGLQTYINSSVPFHRATIQTSATLEPLSDVPPQRRLLIIPPVSFPYLLFELPKPFHFLGFLKALGFHPIVFQWDPDKISTYSYCIEQVNHTYQNMLKSGPLCIISFYGGVKFALDIATQIPPTALAVLGQPFFPSLPNPLWTILSNLLTQEGTLPPWLTRLFFSYPFNTKVIKKIADLRNQGPNLHAKSVMIEDSLNTLPPLPYFLARQYLNPLKQADLSKAPCPTLIITPKTQNSLNIKNATYKTVDLTHLGLLISATAPYKVWFPLVRWLEEVINASH